MQLSSDARKEVENLQEFVEEMRKENRRWRWISAGLAAFSVVLTVANALVI